MLFLTDKQNVLAPSHNRLETAGLDPELICGSSGLCLSPCLPCQVWSETAHTQSCVPTLPLLSLWGREAPTAPGAAQVSSSFVLSRVIAPGLTQGSDSPSSPPHPPQLLGWPLHSTPGTPSAAWPHCSRTGRMLQTEKVLDLFQRCCGKSCTPMASLGELHPTAVPISHPAGAGTRVPALHLPVLQLLLAWEMHTSILRRKLIQKKRKKQ